jgi:hypothetical protein
VFYLTGRDGKKLDNEEVEQLRSALLEAAQEPAKARAA